MVNIQDFKAIAIGLHLSTTNSMRHEFFFTARVGRLATYRPDDLLSTQECYPTFDTHV